MSKLDRWLSEIDETFSKILLGILIVGGIVEAIVQIDIFTGNWLIKLLLKG